MKTRLEQMTGIQRLRFAIFIVITIVATISVFSEFSTYDDNSFMIPFYIGLVYANTTWVAILFESVFRWMGKGISRINTVITDKANEYL